MWILPGTQFVQRGGTPTPLVGVLAPHRAVGRRNKFAASGIALNKRQPLARLLGRQAQLSHTLELGTHLAGVAIPGL